MNADPNTDTLTAGVASATKAAQPQYSDAERADVKLWLKRIDDAQKFDEAQRKQYAIDRKYARGDAGKFEVDVPIAQSYIDVLKSFLYARDPDLNCQPAPATDPPPEKELLDMARDQAQQQLDQQQAQQQQQAQALGQHLGPMISNLMQPGPDGQSPIGKILPMIAGAVGGQGGEPPPQPGSPDDPVEQQAEGQAKTISKPYQQLRENAKQLAATLEVVVAHLWKKARLKAQAEPQVGSALTLGVGWLKASWQERTADDPIIRNQMNDLQDNLARLTADQEDLAEGEGDTDALKASIEQQLEGLQAKVEVMVARGLAVDFVRADDIQVSTDVLNMACYRDSPWISHRTFMGSKAAESAFPRCEEKIKAASSYYPEKPVDNTERRDVGIMTNVSATDADSYKKGGDGRNTNVDGSVCVYEIWNKDTNMVLTLIEGIDCYAKEPFAPDPGTSRFYPFFQYAIGTIDGERHPKSLIARSARLFDEYNRTRSAFAEHRRRIIPKTAFDSTNYDPTEIKRLEGGGIGEMVAIKPLRPGDPVGHCLQPIAYPPIDPALYDTAPIRAELETVWGVQEALSSSIHVAKTATEAEIQQTGTNSRTGYMRDGLDDMLSDLAEYSAEVVLQKLSHDDVVQIAGPWSFWPENLTIEDLAIMVSVDIRAGSTGKPNTSQKQQVWAQVMPVLQNAIQQVGALRKSDPGDIADCIDELVRETLNRTGDRIDAERFLPEAQRTPPPPPPPPPTPLQDTALMGPQTAALTQILADVKAGILMPDSAHAAIQATFPAVPKQLVDAMVQGSIPAPGTPPMMPNPTQPNGSGVLPPPGAMPPSMPPPGAMQ